VAPQGAPLCAGTELVSRKLREPEIRMLNELAEPNSNPGNWWHFSGGRFLRQLRPLARLGLAKLHYSDQWGETYSLTAAGETALKTGRTE